MIRNNLFSAFLTLCLLCSCSRTTMVSGRITNIRTGNPVAGMPVTLYVSNGNEPRDSSNPKIVGESSTTTNSNGEYALEYSGIGIDGAWLEINESLYCYAHFEEFRSGGVVTNKSSEVDIQIDSADGRIRLLLQNQSGLSEKIFVRVDCDATGPKGHTCCNRDVENNIQPGQSETLSFSVSADRFVPVYWGTSQFSGWNAPHVDSVYCPRGQTTWLLLSF